MEQIYLDTARILKAISDPKRLKIVDMLSCKEQCSQQTAAGIRHHAADTLPRYESPRRIRTHHRQKRRQEHFLFPEPRSHGRTLRHHGRNLPEENALHP